MKTANLKFFRKKQIINENRNLKFFSKKQIIKS